MSEKREPCFWSCKEDNETLTHESVDEAVEEYLTGMLPSPCPPRLSASEVLDVFPETVEVYGYARCDGPGQRERKAWADSLIEQLYEWIDDEYGDPDGRTEHESEPAATDIAVEMVDKALEGYVVWRCEFVEKQTVNVLEWARRESPEWFKEHA